MKANPCRCGATPEFARDRWGEIRMLQLRCACGIKGATLMYTRGADAARTRQVAIDGWNLADHGSGQNHTSPEDQ